MHPGCEVSQSACIRSQATLATLSEKNWQVVFLLDFVSCLYSERNVFPNWLLGNTALYWSPCRIPSTEEPLSLASLSGSSSRTRINQRYELNQGRYPSSRTRVNRFSMLWPCPHSEKETVRNQSLSSPEETCLPTPKKPESKKFSSQNVQNIAPLLNKNQGQRIHLSIWLEHLVSDRRNKRLIDSSEMTATCTKICFFKIGSTYMWGASFFYQLVKLIYLDIFLWTWTLFSPGQNSALFNLLRTLTMILATFGPYSHFKFVAWGWCCIE